MSTRLTYEIEIAAAPALVWDTMIDPELYSEWTKAFSENSQFRGTWAQGEIIDFVDPGKGGTRAVLEEVERPHRIVARHFECLGPNQEVDTESPHVKTWVGSVETYILEPNGDGTRIRVEMDVHPDWQAMFNDSWPGALKLLKELCEREG